MRNWTPEEISLMVHQYPNTDSAVIARRIGRDVDAVNMKAARLGIRKSTAYMDVLNKQRAAQMRAHRYTPITTAGREHRYTPITTAGREHGGLYEFFVFGHYWRADHA